HLMVERLRMTQKSGVDVLGRALEARDGRAASRPLRCGGCPDCGDGHCVRRARAARPGSLSRLAAASRELGAGLGLSPAHEEALELGARLHDIGEVRTPEAVLTRPGPLPAAERAAIEQHPAAGVEILETAPQLTPALDVVASHHERWDGGGYPQGLRG